MSRHCVFTDNLIERVSIPDGARIVLRDRKMPGLECRISATGVKTFSVFKRMNGSAPERVTIGRFPAIRVKEARRLAAKISGAIADGGNPATVKRLVRQELTFEELFFEFLEKHAKIRKRTWKGDLSQYNLYLKRPLGKLKLSHITKVQIRQIFIDATNKARLRKNNPDNPGVVTGMTANRVLALVKTVFNWGISMDICQINPAIGIKKNPEKSRTRFLQADELPNFFKALDMEENETVRDFILISLLTGARRSNVQQMKWEDVSFSRKEWVIPHTKNDEPHLVTLCSEALSVLYRRKANSSPYVFPGSGKQGYFVDPKKGWARLLKRAGLKNLRLHDLRRTLGSWQAKTGASLIVIGKSLGHKSLQSTTVYARLDLDPIRASVETATKAMLMVARKSKISPSFNAVSKKAKTDLNFSTLLG